MAGGLMQLAAYGAQDIYLTGAPQITYFKIVYRRYTNFASEVIEHNLVGNINFGNTLTATLTRDADLVSKMYVKIVLGAVNPQGNNFAWVRRIGHAIIDQVEIELGGTVIDRNFGTWLDVWYELARGGDHEVGYAAMIGDVPLLTDYNSEIKEEYTLFVPLQFWFNRYIGLAVPLIALQYHDMRIHIRLREKKSLFIRDCNFDDSTVTIKNATLLTNYIYLDTDERRRFAQVGHEYLIEQLQFNGPEPVNSLVTRYILDFNHPTKELIWAMKNGNYTTGKEFVYYSPTWSQETINLAAEKIIKESITLNNKNLFTSLPPQQNNKTTYTNRQLNPTLTKKFNFGCYDILANFSKGGFGTLPVTSTPQQITQPQSPTQSPTPTPDIIFGDESNIGNRTLHLNDTCSSNNITSSQPLAGSPNPANGTWTEVSPSESKTVGTICVRNCYTESVYVNPNSLLVGEYGITNKINADVIIETDGTINCVNITTSLSIRDLSIPVELMTDSRCEPCDPQVYQFNNYGVLIDGSINPIQFGQLKLNGHDRFDKREGAYFNYVQPHQHHSNTPADGINVYSFSLSPEEHQPSGTANLSRIDDVTLTLWFNDPTQTPTEPKINFLNNDNELFNFGTNNNILRMINGLAGIAYVLH